MRTNFMIYYGFNFSSAQQETNFLYSVPTFYFFPWPYSGNGVLKSICVNIEKQEICLKSTGWDQCLLNMEWKLYINQNHSTHGKKIKSEEYLFGFNLKNPSGFLLQMSLRHHGLYILSLNSERDPDL